MDPYDDEEGAHPSRDRLRTEMLKAGWPNSSTYAAGMGYADKLEAIAVYERFLDEICEMGLMNYVAQKILIDLGPLAKTNLPRALNMIGFIPSDEGGEGTSVLPDFWQWPVLNTDPEAGG